MMKRAINDFSRKAVLVRYSAKASATVTMSQVRFHHPSPFDPQTTKGWAAAKKVRIQAKIILCSTQY